MNGFSEDAWFEILQDPRVGGDSEWMGAGAGNPFPWQVDTQSASPDEIADQVAEIIFPDAQYLPGWVAVQGNLPLDAFGLPDL